MLYIVIVPTLLQLTSEGIAMWTILSTNVFILTQASIVYILF